jgi:hypothetical protein
MKRIIISLAFLLAALGAHAQVSSQLFATGPNHPTTVQCYSDGNNVAAQVYGNRIWDDGAKIPNIFISSLTPTWTTMDLLINTRFLGTNARAGINVAIGANCPGTSTMKVLYTFGSTPEWASVCQGQGDPSPCLPGPTGTTLISSTCSITSGAAILTCPGASPGFQSFTSTEGPAITVTGAGAAGGTLTTYILTYTSATQVTLAANASTTVTATGVATLRGFGGGTKCVGPASNPDFGCTAYADNTAGGVGETDATMNAMTAAIVARYAGQVTHYEQENEPDSTNFACIFPAPTSCGGGNPLTTANTASLSRLVRMNWDRKHIIACGDAAAKTLSPSFHVGTALSWFHYYNITTVSAPAGVSGVNGVPVGCNWSANGAVTGAMTYDYVNVHPRGTNAAYPTAAGNWNPAAIITAYNNTSTECTNDSLPNCPATIFGNEFGYNSSLEGGSNTTGYSAYVAQGYTFCASLGFTSCWWYQWDSNSIGLQGALQGTAYDTVAGWLIGATITSPCALVGALYECGLTKGGVTELIAWDTSKYATNCCLAPANQTYGAAYNFYVDLAGVTRATSGGGVAPTGWSPILLQQLSTPPVSPTIVSGQSTISGGVTIH